MTQRLKTEPGLCKGFLSLGAITATCLTGTVLLVAVDPRVGDAVRLNLLLLQVRQEHHASHLESPSIWGNYQGC